MAEGGDELGPLPSGRHGLTPEQVSHHQRERLIAALAEVVVARGYADVTITDITRVAAVSRRTFYEHFESKEACFLAAYDVVIDHVHGLIEAAIEPVPDWPHRVLAGLAALLSFFDSEPDLAHLCLLDSLTAGPAIAERFQRSVGAFVPLLAAGRGERAAAAPPLPDSTERTIIGSLASMIARSILSGSGRPLVELLPDFAEFVLAPYLGPEAARRLARESD